MQQVVLANGLVLALVGSAYLTLAVESMIVLFTLLDSQSGTSHS